MGMCFALVEFTFIWKRNMHINGRIPLSLSTKHELLGWVAGGWAALLVNEPLLTGVVPAQPENCYLMLTAQVNILLVFSIL